MKIFKKILFILIIILFIFTGIKSLLMGINNSENLFSESAANILIFFGILKIVYVIFWILLKDRVLVSYVLTGYMAGVIMTIYFIYKDNVKYITIPGIILLVVWLIIVLNKKEKELKGK